LTSTDSIAILVGTGGLGMVESPAALATANRLLSAGFAAQSIGQLYKNSKAFKEAYDRGDQTEALYQATHAVLSGAMTAMAAQHAIVGGTPAAATAAERAVGAKIGETAQAGVTKVGEIASAAKSRLGETKLRLLWKDTAPDQLICDQSSKRFLMDCRRRCASSNLSRLTR